MFWVGAGEVGCISRAPVAEKRIRHLPLVKDGELWGLVSIGDLMKSALADREFHIEQLVEYVGR